MRRAREREGARAVLSLSFFFSHTRKFSLSLALISLPPSLYPFAPPFPPSVRSNIITQLDSMERCMEQLDAWEQQQQQKQQQQPSSAAFSAIGGIGGLTLFKGPTSRNLLGLGGGGGGSGLSHGSKRGQRQPSTVIYDTINLQVGLQVVEGREWLFYSPSFHLRSPILHLSDPCSPFLLIPHLPLSSHRLQHCRRTF